jgi:hypothetical protein
MINESSSIGKIIFAILFFLCFTPSHTVADIVIEFTEEIPEGVFFYEVEIEQEEDGGFRKIQGGPPEPWEPAEKLSLNISLLPGSYQGRIIFYDSENRRIGRTEWASFEVVLPEPIEVTIIIYVRQKPPPKRLFFFGPSWATFTPLYGELTQYFGFKILPPGPRLGFDMILFERGAFNGGMELAASWFYLNNFFDEHNITVHMIMLDFNILIQKQFSYQRVTLSFRLGMGLTILADKETQKGAVDMNPLTAQINTGVSFLWLIKDSSYIETGIDFSHMFGWDAGGLRPWISFGIRF